jgi:hypothetical protein
MNQLDAGLESAGSPSQKLALIGLTRFSVVNQFTMYQFAQTREADLEAARARIFAPERLKHRFALFEALTLPSMVALASQYACFWHVVLISPGLPAPWRNRLDHLAAGTGAWCRVREVADHDNIAKAASLAAAECAEGRRVFSFRLDDDDAVSIHYLDAARKAAAAAPDGTVISFDTGVKIQGIDAQGAIVAPSSYPFIALGLGHVGSPHGGQTIFDLGSHRTIRQRAATVQLADQTYWCRSVHATSDAGKRSAPKQPKMNATEIARRLSSDFPFLDFERLVAALA